MKNFFSLTLTILICISFCACGNNYKEEPTTTETTTSFIDTRPALDPTLERLQGCWAASENYKDDSPDFLCSMPATWDDNMKGYYILVISDNTLIYRWFHSSGNNGRPGGYYSSYISDKEYEIKTVTEITSDENKSEFLLDLEINEVSKQVRIELYDNSEIYKNSFLHSEFEDFMFLKLSGEQYNELMNKMYSIKNENSKNNEKLAPYIGMPKEKLKNSSWGSPDDINITEIENHTFEQWCYSNNRYVYVDDGYVSAIQK